MDKIEGSVFRCTHAEIQLLLKSLDPIIKLGHLKNSDKLFWNTAYTTHFTNDIPGDIIVHFDHVFDDISGIPSPDTRTGSPLRFSRSTRNNRIKKFLAANIIKLNETPKLKLKIIGKGNIYSLVIPDISNLEPPVAVRKRFEASNLPLSSNSDREKLITEIDKIYSFEFATNYLDIVLAPSLNYDKKTIEAPPIPVADDNGDAQRLRVAATCYDDSKLMIPKDKLIAKYFQSAAIQYMWEHTEQFITEEAENRFTFNLRDVLVSTGGSDSGSARSELHRSIVRVCGVKFELDGEDCPDFMRSTGFYDENGNVLSRAYFSHLTMLGETNDLNGVEVEEVTRQTPLYITLAIPDQLYTPTRKALILASRNEEYISARPQLFRNNDKLQFKEHTGYQDTLSDFLKPKVVFGNQMNTRLKRVLSQWLVANKKQTAGGVYQFFRAIENCMIQYSGRVKSTRSQYKYASCLAYFSEFVVECVATDISKQRQFASIDYEITFHHVYPNQANRIKEYIEQINKMRADSPNEYVQVLSITDFNFAKWLKYTMTEEGKAEAKKLHAASMQQKVIKPDGLVIDPIVVES